MIDIVVPESFWVAWMSDSETRKKFRTKQIENKTEGWKNRGKVEIIYVEIITKKNFSNEFITILLYIKTFFLFIKVNH